MKISAKTRDCRLLVKVKTSLGETVDKKELDRFERVYLRCFLKPKLLKNNLLEYTGPASIPLSDRLRREITKRDFLFIIEHVAVAIQKLRANNFHIVNLNMDIHNIFINEQTKELQFLYVPLVQPRPTSNVINLFSAIIYSARPAAQMDKECISRFHAFFQTLRPFDVDKVEAFVLREDRSVVNSVKKYSTGQSGFMTSKQKSYLDYMDAQKKTQDEEATGILDEDEPTGLLVEDEPTGLLIEEEPTGLLFEEELSDQLSAGEAYNAGWEDDDATGLLEEEATGLLVEEDEGGTALLAAPPTRKAEFTYPELHRVLTNETIKVNKPVFRIGKERSYVDYFVTNNNAVSRSHADIITRAEGYFVVDLNSKNRTYINNRAIPVQTETEIRNGDLLCFGNEEFIFRVEGNRPLQRLLICPNCKTKAEAGAYFCSRCGRRF